VRAISAFANGGLRFAKSKGPPKIRQSPCLCTHFSLPAARSRGYDSAKGTPALAFGLAGGSALSPVPAWCRHGEKTGGYNRLAGKINNQDTS
jgi:hypothetical protein